MRTQNLHLFTASFPVDNAPESVFILPELEFLAKSFENVFLYPNSQSSDISFKLPDNVKVVALEKSLGDGVSIKDYLFIFRIAFGEILRNSNLLKRKNLTYLIALLKKYIQKKNQIRDHFRIEGNLTTTDLIYTYWMDEWCTILSLLKKEIKFNNKFVTRVHGFDLFDERNKFGKIPFRKLQLKSLDKIYSISDTGRKYLTDKNPKLKNKITFARLGVFDHGISVSNQTTLTIISCSSISEVKQLHILVEILAKVTQKVNWVHFGDGPLKKQINESILKLPKNITCELRGNVSNEIILDYYKNNRASIFINVSQSEGIPMSIMEAISFSIPVMAFNVGGMPEIVTKQTGLLVPPGELDAMVVVLNAFPNHPVFSDRKRKEVRMFWEQNFDAAKNHSFFMDKLKQPK